MDWNAISAIANTCMAVTNILLLISIVIGVSTIRESEKTRAADLIVWANSEIEPYKKQIIEILSFPDSSDWTTEQRDQAFAVSAKLQTLSYFAVHGMIDRKHLARLWGRTVVEQWETLKPFIFEFRRSKGEPDSASEGAYFRRDLEIYAAFCRGFLNYAYQPPKPQPQVRTRKRRSAGR